MMYTEAIAIYIHWPFCQSKCPYCDFNSHVQESIDHTEYLKAYLNEIASYAEVLKGRQIISIFFGGGTPSLARPEMFAKILDFLKTNFDVSEAVEITMEANPTTFETNKFREFKNAGINRLSLGIQSFNDDYLQKLGRTYFAKQAQHAVSETRTIFDNYSFDLIYCHPWHNLKQWEGELIKALELCDKHISLYQLTIEKGTQFYRQFLNKELIPQNNDIAADFYAMTQEIMTNHGLPRYEVSNHAQPGHECKHNLVYWRYQDYLGIGPGAHGRYQHVGKRFATVDLHKPGSWLQAMQVTGVAIQQKTEISDEIAYKERLLMGLRLTDGVNQSIIAASDALSELLEYKLLVRDGTNIKATEAGNLVLDSVIARLTA